MISKRTAKLGLDALDIALRRRRRDGLQLPADIRRAREELFAAATAPESVSPTRQNLPGTGVDAEHWVSVKDAAHQLGVSPRTVERRAAAGLIPARRAGERQWQIRANGDHSVTTTETANTDPPRYVVRAAYVSVRSGVGAGFPMVRGNTMGLGYYADSILPPDADPEDVERLLRKGMIARIEEN